MKRIAIFCDGTWQRSDMTHPSNVVRLAQAARSTDDIGVTQQVLYLPGVGTGRGSTKIGRWLDRSAGGALGWGLDLSIEDAYRDLVFCYEPGDEIFVFGFSRGAYTARSLLGLIRRAGILLKAHVDRVPDAMRLYRTRGDRASTAIGRRSLEFRGQFAHHVATVRHEGRWRRCRGLPDPRVELRVSYVGVWDTVGALGLPNYLIASRWVNGDYKFHDTALSALALRARHAVAVDERRLAFAPTLWDNLPDLNRRALGLWRGSDLAGSDLRYRQDWFPGDHGSIGGGNAMRGLSSYACAWIAEGAAEAGFAFDEPELENIRRDQHIGEALTSRTEGPLSRRLWRMRDREGPDDPALASAALRRRVREVRGYEPPTIKAIIDALRADP